MGQVKKDSSFRGYWDRFCKAINPLTKKKIAIFIGLTFFAGTLDVTLIHGIYSNPLYFAIPLHVLSTLLFTWCVMVLYVRVVEFFKITP